MASPVEIKLILCDAAVADPHGKVHMLGAGWSVMGTPTGPHAVVVLAKVPWDRANQKLKLSLELVDQDGTPVQVPRPEDEPLKVGQEAELEVGRPPGIAPGSMLNAAFTVSLPALPLAPGRYTWNLNLADAHDSETFTVR